MKVFNIKLFANALLILVVLSTGAYAIGEIGVGFNTGIAYDPNNIEDMITEYNINMEAYKAANPGTEVSQINLPYSPIFGVNIRYNFNYLLFRIGGTYARSVYFDTDGSINTASGINKIEIDTYQASFPGSIGLMVPLKKRAIAYIGGGMNLHFSYLSVKQSIPGGGFVTPDDSRNRYSGMFGGFHVLFGIEFPISSRYTISGEWIHQMGSSPMIKSEDSSSEISIKINSDILLFGINYYISI